MKRVTRNGLIVAAAASGALAAALPAHADSAADGTAAGSPGLISGNTIQLPVHVPVNVCGDTVNVLGVLNPATGNTCANQGARGGGPRPGTAPGGGASSYGRGKDSSGVLAGNDLQLPVHLPVNITGNSVSVAGAGNTSTNTSGERPHPAPRPVAPPKAYTPTLPPRPAARPVTLAHTGADATLPAVAGGAALVLCGTVLYRRFRPGAAG
ncbi:chaplin [Streptomyces sp. NPDC001634]|uniref:chaplin n=1 Tax=Streptomyces sp. NPDC001634 TaxID=3154390 RepID=UPI00332EAEF7